MVVAASPVETMQAEFRQFVVAGLASAAGADERREMAAGMFHTTVRPDDPVERMIELIMDNPFNTVGAVVHVGGPTEGTPLYVVHAMDGETGWMLSHLANASLPGPVFGVNAPPWVGEKMPATTEELAQWHVANIRTVHGDGPLSLAGFSSGAYLVLEIAYLLAECGIPVNRVMIVDPGPPGEPWSMNTVVNFRLSRIRNGFHPELLAYRSLGEELSARDVLSMLEEPLPTEPIHRRFLQGLGVLHGIATMSYPAVVTAVDARCTVFISGKQLKAYEGDTGPCRDAVAGWFTGEPSVVVLDTFRHSTVFGDPVLQDHLGEALAGK